MTPPNSRLLVSGLPSPRWVDSTSFAVIASDV